MPDKPSITVLTDAPGPAQLGEGPVWDDRSGELVWVDIAGRRIHRWDPISGASSSIGTEGDVGAVVLCEDGGMMAAVECELWKVSTAGEWTLLASVDPKPGVRFNDCRADPRGRLWAGTLHRDREPAQAALYRLEPGGGLTMVLPERTISNGIGWSPDGETMYYIDSTTWRVVTYDYDLDTGNLGHESVFTEIDPADGLPDGMMVDAGGGVWVCLFGGAKVRRYSPDGVLEREIALPLTNPTCPAFGGTDLRTMYITTARHRLSAEQLEREPNAGTLLQLDVGVGGNPAHRFGG
ncbi:MAG TPA: SMP-30/gluconolactonase/LRE family protein [Ilumatobacteraceae bacterium]|nr:SMP-30/gluconolactonase/LRE family protein [Ilumatobacteraceae bacterium]